MSATAATAGPPRTGSTPRALYRLALEKAHPRARYHAVAEEGVPFKAIAEVIGHRLGVPVVSKSPEEADRRISAGSHSLRPSTFRPRARRRVRLSAGRRKKKG